MRNDKLLLLYPFEMYRVGAQKDLGRIPKALYQFMNVQTRIFCFCFREEIPKVKGVEIQSFSQNPRFLGGDGMRYLHEARSISKEYDHVMFFGTSFRNYFLMRQYRKANPTGKIYWKLDIDKSYLELWRGDKWAGKMAIKRPMNNQMLEWADVVSVETKACYLQLSEWIDPGQRHKVMYLPNGFDDEQTLGMKLDTEKKPVLQFVGRLDDPIKNAVELLRRLSQLDYKGEFRFIGPAKEDGEFLTAYRSLCTEINGFESRVRWLGELTEREDLYRQYGEAMGLVLASSRESFGIVLGEAAYFNNYIISTQVGAASDITDNGKYGAVVETGDWDGLMTCIQSAFKRANETMEMGRKQGEYYRANFLYRNLFEDNQIMQEYFNGEK